MEQGKQGSRRQWQRFMDTGEIGAYLLYRAMRTMEGDGPAGERGNECRSSAPRGS